jgi:cytochrome c5
MPLRTTLSTMPRSSRRVFAALLFALVAATARAQTPLPAVPGEPAPAAAAAAAAATDANRIVEVRIEGNHATEVSKLPKLVTRAGQIFDPQAIGKTCGRSTARGNSSTCIRSMCA